MDINQILELAKAIGELGILVIIASVFIYMVYQNWKIKQTKDSSNEESFKKLISDIQEQNNNLLEKILEVTTPKSITPEQFTEHSKASQKINEALERARSNNDASRCALVQFHNGGHNLFNQSLKINTQLYFLIGVIN